MSHANDKERLATDPEDSWEELLSALDTGEVSEDCVIERDMRPAEERPALHAFFSPRNESGAEEESNLAD